MNDGYSNLVNIKNQSKTIVYVLFSSSFPVIIFLLKTNFDIAVSQPIVPLQFGILKDFLDIFIVLFFSWHGWIFGLTLITLSLKKPSITHTALAFFLSSFFISCITTLRYTNNPSIQKLITGFLTYAAINGAILILFLSIKTIFHNGISCQK